MYPGNAADRVGFVTHVCQPPVPVTAQVPTSVPLVPSRWISMFPPLVADATLA